jgi:hypothetical protein
VDQVIIEWLVHRQFLQRALEKRDCHIRAFTSKGLSAKSNLIRQNAVEVSARIGNINRLAGLLTEARS